MMTARALDVLEEIHARDAAVEEACAGHERFVLQRAERMHAHAFIAHQQVADGEDQYGRIEVRCDRSRRIFADQSGVEQEHGSSVDFGRLHRSDRRGGSLGRVGRDAGRLLGRDLFFSETSHSRRVDGVSL
jgi:hypothetical protein